MVDVHHYKLEKQLEASGTIVVGVQTPPLFRPKFVHPWAFPQTIGSVWSRGFYIYVQLLAQMLMVPAVVWKSLQRTILTCECLVLHAPHPLKQFLQSQVHAQLTPNYDPL